MEKPPVSITTSDDHLQLQTWNLRVYVHCEGCKRKVFKVLQSIDGVYKTVIDSNQHKATVTTGSVNGDTLVQKLLKSGKHAEILTEKKNQNDDVVTTVRDDNEDVDDEKAESESLTTDGNDKTVAEPTVGKKKKKKGYKNNKLAQSDGRPTANTGVTVEQLHLDPPSHETVMAAPYDLPPYHKCKCHYPLCYSASYPNVESSYHPPPVYGSHSSVYYHHPQPPNSAYYRRSAFDDNDDEGGDGRRCTFM